MRLRLTGIALIVVLWQLVNSTELVEPLFLPSPTAVGRAFLSYLTESTLFSDLGRTTYRCMAGLILSVIIGVPLGILLGISPLIRGLLGPTTDFLRSVPSSTLFPLFILLFGIQDRSKIAVVVFGCSLVIAIATAYGFRDTPERRLRALTLQALGANAFQILLWARLPAAASNVLASLRVSLSLALVLVIVTEMFLGSTTGLGKRIYDMYLGYRMPEMYAGILSVGGLGYFMNVLMERAERYFIFWETASNR